MARNLDQILTELNSVYSPQRDVYNAQISQIDPQQQAELSGLDVTKQNAFQGITDQANRRGLLFSGIPIQEQAQYTGGTYLPAVANLKGRYAQQKFNLQDALAKISQDQYNTGQGIYQKELDRDADAARAAGAGAASPTFGGSNASGVLGASKSATATQRADKGYNFTDAYGQPISAAAYAAAKGIPFRTLLQQLANAGDKGALAGLQFIGVDGKYDPSKIRGNESIYNSLTWGVGNNVESAITGNQLLGASGGGW